MNKFEDMARSADTSAKEAKAKRDADSARARELTDAKDARIQKAFDDHVFPVLREVARGLKAAGVEFETSSNRPPFPFEVTAQIGHNKAGQTLDRVAKIKLTSDGDSFKAVTDSPNGNPKDFNALGSGQVEAMISGAVKDGLDRWYEQNGYPHRRVR